MRLRRRADPLYSASRWNGAGLPTLFLVTDPERTPDPVGAAKRLAPGAGVIFRGFGRPDARNTAERLAEVARARRLTLLIGADATLAALVGADGVHLPERLTHLAPRLRKRRPHWVFTAAAHSAGALRRVESFGLDAALLSPVFESQSDAAVGVRPFGPMRFAALTRSAGLPVYALGGMNTVTAARLDRAWGLAAVAALAE